MADRLITFWSGSDIHAHPQTLRDELIKNNAEWFADMLPAASSPATALERARRCRPGTGFQFRKLGRDIDGNAHVGLVEESTDPNAQDLNDAYDAQAIFTASSKKDGTLTFSFVPSQFQCMADKLQTAFRKEAGYLTQPDLGVLFTRLCLGRWKGVRIKPGTALFICPNEIATEKDNVNAALSAAGVGVQFYSDTVQQEDQFAEPIKLSLLGEIDDLVKGVSKLQEKADEGKSIRYDTLSRRLQAAKDMMAKASLYKDILKTKNNEIEMAVDGYKKTVMDVMKTLASQSE